MSWPIGIVLFLIALVVFLYFWFSWDSLEVEDDLSYQHWRKLDYIKELLACTDRMEESLRSYVKGNKTGSAIQANESLDLLDEYNHVKDKMEGSHAQEK